ncbi:cytochrome P450 [Candidatus Uabimicrobium sp. HlEnr_7]|uniref:cytochrome P450 n=1 Tax=Candidatus Uabimicrobium helgolandensis TaxID=3095367 RepID=UPI0035566389
MNFLERSTSISLVDILEGNAQKFSDKIAFEFIEKNFTQTSTISFSNIILRAKAIAAVLQQNIKEKQARVILMYPTGIEYVCAILACMYAKLIAVPVHPPVSERAIARLKTILENCSASCILTDSIVLSSVKKSQTVHKIAELPGINKFSQKLLEKYNIIKLPDWGKVIWIDTCKIDNSFFSSWQSLETKDSDIAILQYTSGSTSDPKGVILTHENIIDNVMAIKNMLFLKSSSVIVSWLPIYHDMGLMGCTFLPLCAGFSSTLFSPLDFLQKPYKWLEIISEKRATHSAAPNFAYELCIKHFDKMSNDVDLSSWQAAINSAEPIRHETIERFCETFAPYKFAKNSFCPCYGLAESTVAATIPSKNNRPSVLYTKSERGTIKKVSPIFNGNKPLVSCGKAIVGSQVIIVKDGQICETMTEGEIWLKGQSVANGYWNNEVATERTFSAYLANNDGPYLRTGDLGFLCENELFITGRIKDLIIILGQNFYPQDIEFTIENSHLAIRKGCGAAFAINIEREERLVVVQEVKETTEVLDTIFDSIYNNIYDHHGVSPYEIVLVLPRSISKTTSGKIQRQECRSRYIGKKLQIIATKQYHQNYDILGLDSKLVKAMPYRKRLKYIEKYLSLVLAHILQRKANDINFSVPLKDMNIDSMKLVEFKLKIDELVGCEFDLDTFIELPKLESLANKICKTMNEIAQEIEIEAPKNNKAPGPSKKSKSYILKKSTGDFFSYLENLRSDYGDIVRFYWGDQLFHLISNPEDIEDIFVKRKNDFIRGDVWGPFKYLMGERNLVNSEGTQWKQERRLTQPFFSKIQIKKFVPEISKITAPYIDKWSAVQSVDLLFDMKEITLKVISKKLFGLEDKKTLKKLLDAFDQMEYFWDVPVHFLLNPLESNKILGEKSYERFIATIDQLIYSIIDGDIETTDSSNIFAVYLQSDYLKNKSKQEQRKHLRNVAVTLISTGFATTASALFWSLYLLSENPNEYAKLQNSIDTQQNDKILERNPYLNSVICESLRLYPPVWYVGRQATIDTHIKGYEIPEKSFLLTSPYIIHRHPQVWKNPKQFVPERFHNNKNIYKTKGYLPFGLGQRFCSGGLFAMYEIAIILSMITENFNINLVSEPPSLSTVFTLHPRKPVYMNFTKR